MGDLVETKWSVEEGRVFCCDGEIRMGLLSLEVVDVMNVLMMSVVVGLRWLVRKRLIRVDTCWRGRGEECLMMLRELREGY